MKRANRQIQISALERELVRCHELATKASRRPVALMRRHPLLSMLGAVLTVGLLTRGTMATRLPTALKLLGVPVVRKLLVHTLTLYRQNSR